MNPRYAHLFSPIRLGHLTLVNRVMMTPTSNVLARNRLPTEAQAAFYAARAAGGVGVIVTEGLRVHPTNCSPQSVGTYDPAVVPGLKRIAERVRKHGVPIIGQIMHGGRQSHQHTPHLLWAPSAVPCLYSGYTPHAMTTAEVESMRDHFVLAALRVQDAGWDGVELHAAQGHLVQQFLSPLSNVRIDRFGGDFERRVAFALEVLERLRARSGDAFVVGLRLASTEFVAGGLEVDDAIAIARAIAARIRIDYLSVSQANFMSIAGHIPDRREPPHPYAEQVRRIRAALPGVPVVATARIRTPAEAEELIADGATDLVGLTRALIADPDWTRKARDADLGSTIRQCVYCNVCWHGITQLGAISCIQNPYAGRELELPPIERAAAAKRVVVIGGGPAGLAAAQAAGERGHRVTLLERDGVLGGQLRWAARVPGDGELGAIVAYLAQAVARLGVEVRLGTNANAVAIAAMAADAIIVATGSRAPASMLPGVRDVPVRSVFDVIEPGSNAWRRVLVLDRDGYFATYAIAELLAAQGIEVVLASWHTAIGHDIPATNLTTSLGRLDRLGVQLYPAHDLVRADRDGALLRHVYSHREKSIGRIDAIVVSGGQRAESALHVELVAAQAAPSIELVGDALAPRAIKDAIHEGHRVGRSI